MRIAIKQMHKKESEADESFLKRTQEMIVCMEESGWKLFRYDTNILRPTRFEWRAGSIAIELKVTVTGFKLVFKKQNNESKPIYNQAQKPIQNRNQQTH